MLVINLVFVKKICNLTILTLSYCHSSIFIFIFFRCGGLEKTEIREGACHIYNECDENPCGDSYK